MNLTVTLVAATVAGALAPAIAEMAIQPALASKRAANFSIAESAAVIFASQAEQLNEIDNSKLPDICSLEDLEDSAWKVSCTKGAGQFAQTVERSFRLIPDDFNGLQVTTDLDLDGFDDTTGMPTHYWECYSGWKGIGSVKNNCTLGGQYVIPAYAKLYE